MIYELNIYKKGVCVFSREYKCVEQLDDDIRSNKHAWLDEDMKENDI